MRDKFSLCGSERRGEGGEGGEGIVLRSLERLASRTSLGQLISHRISLCAPSRIKAPYTGIHSPYREGSAKEEGSIDRLDWTLAPSPASSADSDCAPIL